MARLGSMLTHIVSLASLTVACSDEASRGTCYGNPGPNIYSVPIGVSSGAGAAGAEAGGDGGVGGAAEPDCHAYCALGESCQIIDNAGELFAQCVAQSQGEPFPCPPPGVAIGRRPEGLLAPRSECERDMALGAFFAKVAHLEAASIHAFVRLGHELRSHGADAALVRHTRQAARDEVRHAAQMSRFAKRYGARVARAQLPRRGVRSLFELARENEVEGCVRETFGAAVALWQTDNAATPEMRTVFAGIASDEVAHAELAWQLRAWLIARLTEPERAELQALQRTALVALREELTAEPPAAWRDVAGLPNAATAMRLLTLLADRLLARAASSDAAAKAAS